MVGSVSSYFSAPMPGAPVKRTRMLMLFLRRWVDAHPTLDCETREDPNPHGVRLRGMTTRHAACSCGQLQLTAEGEPIRISMCHCLACQRRTGSAFGMQARFSRDQVSIEGRSTEYVRSSDEGESRTFNF